METTTQDQPNEEFIEPAQDFIKVNGNSANHLLTIARWTQFLAIVGFVYCGLMFFAIIGYGFFFGSLFSMIPNFEAFGAGFGVLFIVIMLASLLFYLAPCYYLYQYANKVKGAIALKDEHALAIALENLKSYFKFFGITVLVILAIYAIFIVVGVFGGLLGAFL